MRRLVPFGLLVLAGCQSHTLRDPNDVRHAGANAPTVARTLLQQAGEAFFFRSSTGEISDEQARGYLREYARYLLEQLPKDTDPRQGWEIAEVAIAAEDWRRAAPLLEASIKAAPDQDRRVNDSLRLARALALSGEAARAIEVARSVFDAPPPDKAPILPAVLLEITPAVEGKGQDVALAQLLVDAVTQAEQTQVDPGTQPGQMFLLALPRHRNNAYLKAEALFKAGGRPDLALKLAEKLIRRA